MKFNVIGGAVIRKVKDFLTICSIHKDMFRNITVRTSDFYKKIFRTVLWKCGKCFVEMREMFSRNIRDDYNAVEFVR